MVEIKKNAIKLHLTANTKVGYFNYFHQKLGDPIVSSPFVMTNCCPTASIWTLMCFFRFSMLQWPLVQIWGEPPTIVIHSFIYWLSDRLDEISSKHRQSQTGRARELKFWENVHLILCVTCHMSSVTYQKKITFVFNNNKKKIKKISLKNIGHSGGASRSRVCYQRGLPLLV